jgi:hypothetical protein
MCQSQKNWKNMMAASECCSLDTLQTFEAAGESKQALLFFEKAV